MTTLNHEVWANPTTPLFLQSGANANNIAPFIVKTADGTQQTAILAQSEGGGTYSGGIVFSPAGGTTAQSYGGLQFFKNVGLEGWYLSTDGTPQMYGLSGGQGGTIVTQAPVYISGVNEASTLELTTKSVGFQNNNASRITFEPTSVNLGQQFIAQDGQGLVVQTSNAVTASITSPSNVSFVTNSFITATTTFSFASTTLPAQGYNGTDNPDGVFFLSSSAPPIYAGGITYTNPALSPIGLSVTGTPPASGKAIWVGSTPNSIAKTMYIEFPPILAPVGTPVSVQWKQVGQYSYGAVYKNDVLLDNITASSSATTWSTSTNYTFTSTGDDRIYIEISTETMPPNVNYYYFNISDIAITTANPTQTTNGLVGMNGSAVRMSNIFSGASVEADAVGGASMTSSVANGTSLALTNKIRLNAPTIGVEVNGGLNMITNAISNASTIFFANTNISGAFSNILTLTASNVSNVGNFNISSGNIVMSNNNLLGASNVTTTNLDAPSGSSNLSIGNNSLSTFIYKLGTMTGLTGGGTISNIRYINNDAGCSSGIFHYLVSFDGTKAVSAPLPPKQTITGRNNNTFGSNYNGDSFTSSVGFTLPAYSVFTYSNLSSGVDNTFSNTNNIPYYFPDTGVGFSPSSSSQLYSLVPIIT
jgi:hypothetical protein